MTPTKHDITKAVSKTASVVGIPFTSARKIIKKFIYREDNDHKANVATEKEDDKGQAVQPEVTGKLAVNNHGVCKLSN